MVIAGSACATDDVGSTESPLSWEAYQAAAYQEPDTGVYVVNGDEAITDLDELFDTFLQYQHQAEAEATGLGRSQGNLIVNMVNGQRDVWSAGAAQNISYCISTKAFSASRKQAVVAALNSAAADWETAGNGRINFVYHPEQDGNCNNRNSSVVFDVSSVCRGQYVARSFFPSDSRRNRELLIDCTAFGNLAPWTLTGVLRHELGHTLGFRHEHVVAPGNPCPEGGTWQQLTAYDAASVMHYPQCAGTQNGDLVLTNLDRQGLGVAYP